MSEYEIPTALPQTVLKAMTLKQQLEYIWKRPHVAQAHHKAGWKRSMGSFFSSEKGSRPEPSRQSKRNRFKPNTRKKT